MNSYDTLEIPHFFYKKKICILGGLEQFKDEFQKKLSSNCLPIQNKRNIGVNISKIDYLYKSEQKFEYLLWNIDCGQHRASLRTIFYSGADAIIIFISEKRIDQIRQYFNEIQTRFPEILLLFCIITDKMSKEEIIDSYLKHEQFWTNIKKNSFQIEEISEVKKIFNQISQVFEDKVSMKNYGNKFIIDFISIKSLHGLKEIIDECCEYYEPETPSYFIQKNANSKLLRKYIRTLVLDVDFQSNSWIRVRNKEFGTFSINLKNGNVIYYPKICESCRVRKCSKVEKLPKSICIEADDRNGWTNIKGFTQNELLILTKIIALKEGNEKNLPRSVLNQIQKVNYCKKHKGKKI